MLASINGSRSGGARFEAEHLEVANKTFVCFSVILLVFVVFILCMENAEDEL